jgi:hypothetical protein
MRNTFVYLKTVQQRILRKSKKIVDLWEILVSMFKESLPAGSSYLHTMLFYLLPSYIPEGGAYQK